MECHITVIRSFRYFYDRNRRDKEFDFW